MTTAFARSFARLARAAGPEQRRQARALVAGDPPWESWRDAFNALHHRDPAREALTAAALVWGARAERRADLAARFLLLEARGRLRSGSPREAARLFARAESALERVRMPERAAAAAAARVDALAHAGYVAQALEVATRAARRFEGPANRQGRAFLTINRANALRLAGDLERARRDYAAAARLLERVGDRPTAAIARLNAGVALLEAGEPERAHRVFQASERELSALGRSDMALEARYDAACADIRRGRLGAAIPALERLLAEHEQAGLARRAALCRLDLADALLRAGDAAQAARVAARAAEGFAHEAARGEEAEARALAARALGASDTRAARRHLARAVVGAQRAERPALELRCRLLDAELGGTPRDHDLRRLRVRARALGQSELVGEATLALAGARLARSDVRGAARALATLAVPANPWLRAARDVLGAQIQARQGRRSAALRRLERACAFLDRVERALPGAWLRSRFLSERLDPWLARVDLLLARGSVGDRRAAARVLDLLAARRFRAEGPTPPADARARALRLRLEALYDRLARPEGPTRRGPGSGVALLLARARRVERALAGRWRTLERRRATAAAARPEPAAPALAPGEAALHLWSRAGRVHGLAEGPDGVGPLHDLGPVDALAAQVERIGFEARRAQLPGGAPADTLGALLSDLAARLLAPVHTRPWPERLLLVLEPTLPDVPFEVLPCGGSLLAHATRLVRVPALAARPATRPAQAGLAILALGETDLPGVADELRSLAGKGEAWAGAQATCAALSRALATHAVVHVAGHGFDAPEAPALGGVRLFDGWYGAADLPPSIGATLVVLAACRTGRRTGPQALAWGGLPSRLLAAGARHVLWTADDVDDATSARLTTLLHAGLAAGLEASTAFGQALAGVAAERGHLGTLLPFRLSGFRP